MNKLVPLIEESDAECRWAAQHVEDACNSNKTVLDKVGRTTKKCKTDLVE